MSHLSELLQIKLGLTPSGSADIGSGDFKVDYALAYLRESCLWEREIRDFENYLPFSVAN